LRAKLVLLAAVCAFGVSVTVCIWLYASHLVHWDPSDEGVYRLAAKSIIVHPSDLYTGRFGTPLDAKLAYLYTPFSALVLAMFSGFSYVAWQLALVIAEIMSLPVICYAAMRIGGYRGMTALMSAFVFAAMAVWLEPVYTTAAYGQINLLLLATTLVDLALPDRFRLKGVGIGLASAVKLTPIIFIAYLLATRRIRAALVATGTFAVTIGIGIAFLPVASRQYWGGGFMANGVEEYLTTNQSLKAIVLRLVPGSGTQNLIWLALEAVVGLAGFALAVIASRRGEELLGVVTCGVTGLLISPISWTHHWVWAVPLLVWAVFGDAVRPIRGRLAIAAGVLAVFVMWPTTGMGSVHYTLLPTGLVHMGKLLGPDPVGGWLRNSYVITGLLFLTVVAGILYVRPRPRPRSATGPRDRADLDRAPRPRRWPIGAI
jgi:alpha-1,2-mannosyltransferase